MEAIASKRMRLTIKTIRALFFIHFFIFIFAFICISIVLLVAKAQGAPSLVVPESAVIYASDGTKIGEEHHGERRFWVKLDDISPYLIDATIAVEDKNFFDHHGFDYKRIAGAAIADLKAMAKVQGASTITQQYARNLYLGFDKTWMRKLKEAFYTIRLEMNYSKKKILEGYLNTIYYGHGAYGAEAASRYYFNKHANELSLAEAALLAGIPKGPHTYSPYVNFDLAKERQETILLMMEKEGYITKTEAELASKEKLDFQTKRDVQTKERLAPYFQDEVMKKVKEILKGDEKLIETMGLKIYTTFDPHLQKMAESAVQHIINRNSDIQVAFVATDPETGEVKALIGGRNYEQSPFNRATQAKRQPGSTIKPFLYYKALENGFTPSTTLKSEPTTFRLEEGNTYSPNNYNGYYANEDITLIEALALSDNIYAVKTHLLIGMDELSETAQSVGIGSESFPKIPSSALGTASVRVIDMVNAYGILANGGKKMEPTLIRKIVDKNGNVLYEQKRREEYVLNQQTAFITTHLMTGMFDRTLNSYTTVTGENIIDQLSRPYAGKSGTTKTDSWMIGFTPQLVAGVWIGYDKAKTIDKVEERSYAKKIWATFMEDALKDKPVHPFDPPGGVVGVKVDPTNGLLAAEGCPVSRLTYYLKGTEPKRKCMEHAQKKKKDPEENGPLPKHEPFFRRLLPWL